MKKQADNYLKRKPQRAEHITWTTNAENRVTLAVANKGMLNRLCQALLKKPAVSYVHLDEIGSFVWLAIDGKKDLLTLGRELAEAYGEAAKPLYERLARFLSVLDSYRFVVWR